MNTLGKAISPGSEKRRDTDQPAKAKFGPPEQEIPDTWTRGSISRCNGFRRVFVFVTSHGWRSRLSAAMRVPRFERSHLRPLAIVRDGDQTASACGCGRAWPVR